MQLQYIGARYIPIFYQNSVDQSANWEINVEYEPLTFVTTQNNHLYLSKKTVPDNIGTPAQNTEYWLDMGIFTDAQIEQVLEELEALEQRVGANEDLGTTDKTTIVNAINELLSDIGNINNLPYPQADNIVGTLNWIDDLITDLRTYTDSQLATKVSKRKYAIITDSYGGTFGGSITPFTTRFASLMGLTEGVDFAKAYLDGAGFVSDGRLFTTPLQQLANSMPGDMVPGDITDLLVLGGCNDSSIISGLGDGISNFITLSAQLFPNARVHVGIIGGFATMTGRRRIFRQVLPYYSQAATYGHRACFIPNLQYIMTHKDLFQSDGIHPNQLGMNFISTALASAMSDGFTASYSTDATFTKDSSFATGTMSGGHVDVCNGRTTLLCNTISMTYSSAQTKSGNLVLGTLNNANIIGWIDVWFPVHVVYSGGNAGTVERTEMATISDNTLYIVMSGSLNFKNLGITRLTADFQTLLC